jgi:hypothetical protein
MRHRLGDRYVGPGLFPSWERRLSLVGSAEEIAEALLEYKASASRSSAHRLGPGRNEFFGQEVLPLRA